MQQDFWLQESSGALWLQEERYGLHECMKQELSKRVCSSVSPVTRLIRDQANEPCGPCEQKIAASAVPQCQVSYR